jgi:hypothetical protein
VWVWVWVFMYVCICEWVGAGEGGGMHLCGCACVGVLAWIGGWVLPPAYSAHKLRAFKEWLVACN